MDINDVSVGQQIELWCSSVKAEKQCRLLNTIAAEVRKVFIQFMRRDSLGDENKVSFNFTVITSNHFFFSFCLGLATLLPEQFPPEPLQKQIQSHDGRRIGPTLSARLFNGVFHFGSRYSQRNDITYKLTMLEK